jgi:hypothetical protein
MSTMRIADPRSILFVACALVAACGSSDGSSNAGAGDASPGGGPAAGAGGETTGGIGGAATGGATSSGGALDDDAGGALDADAGSAPGAIDCREDGDGKTTLVFVNRCSSALTFHGSDIAGGTLAPGAFACIDAGTDTEELAAKRYWAFSGEDPGAGRYTLAEFTFNTDFNDFDWYNISHVDAHNLPMQIVPFARETCETLTCADDFLLGCPEVGQFRNGSGDVVACVSPDRDDGSSPVALYFESCDDAYAWSGDDQNGDDPSPVRACAGEDWDITFCPRL